ncbi:hypothetical protein ACIBI9_31330 [Nonomuraea sp. NPDC050451]|uniref:hypothetical protein n=1 Tax=Nonomuraea sp. NPDC050451 TaxID=3364364 RepID=UPI0037B5342F
MNTIQTGIPGIKCYRNIPENALVLPAVIVQPVTADFDVAFGRGTDQIDFTLLVLVAYNHLEVAQDNLDPYLSGSGSKSIRECIWNNKTLGLEGDVNAHISRMYDYGKRYNGEGQGQAIEQLGARLDLVVYTRGTV